MPVTISRACALRALPRWRKPEQGRAHAIGTCRVGHAAETPDSVPLKAGDGGAYLPKIRRAFRSVLR